MGVVLYILCYHLEVVSYKFVHGFWLDMSRNWSRSFSRFLDRGIVVDISHSLNVTGTANNIYRSNVRHVCLFV